MTEQRFSTMHQPDAAHDAATPARAFLFVAQWLMRIALLGAIVVGICHWCLEHKP